MARCQGGDEVGDRRECCRRCRCRRRRRDQLLQQARATLLQTRLQLLIVGYAPLAVDSS